MELTTSLAWPNMFDVAHNTIGVVSGNQAIVSRDRLLILTEPTELYMNPAQGVGLKRYLWQYNSENTKAMIQDRIKEQLRIFEPCVDSEATEFADGLLFTGSPDSSLVAQEFNQLKMTVGLRTIYGGQADISIYGRELRGE